MMNAPNMSKAYPAVQALARPHLYIHTDRQTDRPTKHSRNNVFVIRVLKTCKSVKISRSICHDHNTPPYILHIQEITKRRGRAVVIIVPFDLRASKMWSGTLSEDGKL
jgi:hypothetical protein